MRTLRVTGSVGLKVTCGLERVRVSASFLRVEMSRDSVMCKPRMQKVFLQYIIVVVCVSASQSSRLSCIAVSVKNKQSKNAGTSKQEVVVNTKV